jgi:ribosomal-protein-alanine N-acetyltransferase
MILRPWRFEDILKISQLEKECFSADPWSYQLFANSFAASTFHTVLAEENGEVIGYAAITVAGDSADIENIAVAEPYRHSGVGGKLLTALIGIAEVEGAKAIFLEVRVSNADAMKLYLKHGFCGVYARPRYYAGGEDALVMKRVLS